MKYKDRYVLGVGYPFETGINGIGLSKHQIPEIYEIDVVLKIPYEIFKDQCPKYRLVLERVKK
jgi:hypothetical protein